MDRAINGYYKLSWRERIGFCSGDLAQNLIYQTVSIWLLFYYNNVFGLDSDVVAVMFLVVLIIDVIWDPMVGAFVDKSTGKLKRVDEATMASMTLEPQLDMTYGDRRIILPKEGGDVKAPISVMRADIDYNSHVNNANYIRMAMELLPDGFEVRGLRVEYRIPAKLGDTLTPTVYHLAADTIVIALCIGSEVSTIVEFKG
jgi:hypothetical protein